MSLVFMPWSPGWDRIEDTVFRAWPVQYFSRDILAFPTIAAEAKRQGVVLGDLARNGYMRRIQLERTP